MEQTHSRAAMEIVRTILRIVLAWPVCHNLSITPRLKLVTLDSLSRSPLVAPALLFINIWLIFGTLKRINSTSL